MPMSPMACWKKWLPAAVLAAWIGGGAPAVGFYSSGGIDGDLGYASLEITKDQEDYWGGSGVALLPRPGRRARPAGGWYGFYTQDEYYLTGSLENLSSRPRYNLRVTFFASDCVRDRTHWTATVAVDHLQPHGTVPFRQFISYSEPEFPCRFRFHVSEAAPGAAAPSALPASAPREAPPAAEAPPLLPAPENPPPPTDRLPVYKWIDENGVPHYTNRPISPDDSRWQPAWGAGNRP